MEYLSNILYELGITEAVFLTKDRGEFDIDYYRPLPSSEASIGNKFDDKSSFEICGKRMHFIQQ